MDHKLGDGKRMAWGPRRLAVYIHRFVVDSVLSFWYRMVDPSRAQMYASQKEEDRRNIINEARETQVKDVYSD